RMGLVFSEPAKETKDQKTTTETVRDILPIPTTGRDKEKENEETACRHSIIDYAIACNLRELAENKRTPKPVPESVRASSPVPVMGEEIETENRSDAAEEALASLPVTREKMKH
ncbi:hypothetical protein PFISCL1PPCAC_21855, partial [Pristionchus fissidentatus]